MTKERFRELRGDEPKRDEMTFAVVKRVCVQTCFVSFSANHVTESIIDVPPQDDPTDKIFVFFPEEPKVGVKTIKNLADKMKSDNAQKALMVVQSNMTPFAKQCLQEMQPKYIIELVRRVLIALFQGRHEVTSPCCCLFIQCQLFFLPQQFKEEELLVNITQHVLVPEHRTLSQEEKKTLLERYKVRLWVFSQSWSEQGGSAACARGANVLSWQ